MTLSFGNMTVNLNIFNVIKGMGMKKICVKSTWLIPWYRNT